MLTLAALTASSSSILPIADLARQEFGADATWYERNIPFFDCADRRLRDTYYYRWRLYKSHIRDLGDKGTLITEFLDDVGWQKWPYAMLNDATSFHIKDGRWLRDPHPIDSFIDFLYTGGGNDRHFSEGIAEATYANFLARGDLQAAAKHLPVMQHVYNLWDDHYDFGKGLYYIEPLLDATEYTISSIDASGGRDGFRGGDAFRPSINAYQFGNARAISSLAALTRDRKTAAEFDQRAKALQKAILGQLWSPELNHFIDLYQVTNNHVRYGTPIRGRELAGYVPWAYEVVDKPEDYAASWRHALDPKQLGGAFGLRTVEPTYEYYMRQYRYEGPRPECQWNGPSWPFQTTQFLTGAANYLNTPHPSALTRTDYYRLLRQYADQHVSDGKFDLQEDYNPDTGKIIVGLERSHHYNHSGFVDLIVTGLCGVRPSADNHLTLNPLIPSAAECPYFCLDNLPYHGHLLSIVWDVDGSHYQRGVGLTVWIDGKQISTRRELGPLSITVPSPRKISSEHEINSAVNLARVGFPKVTASVNQETAWQANDGRCWFFPEMPRGWTSKGSTGTSDWIEIEYAHPTTVGRVALSFSQDGDAGVPTEAILQAPVGGSWRTVGTAAPIGNTTTELRFDPIETVRLRIRVEHQAPFRLVEVATYAK